MHSYRDKNYVGGSRAFLFLAIFFGLTIDVINFIICQIAALFLAYAYRSKLHQSKVSSNTRHLYGIIVTLLFGYFSFGKHVIHIFILPTISYLTIRYQNPETVHFSSLGVSMFYLLCNHLYRQIYDYGGYSMDITGPLMLITQKVIIVGFGLHDGMARDKNQLNDTEKQYAIETIPTPLEYFSYSLCFLQMLAGPTVFYKDYIEFIEGTHYKKYKSPKQRSNSNNTEPSPKYAVREKVILSLICLGIYLKCSNMYPLKNIKTCQFLNTTSFFYKLWYLTMNINVTRNKYYFGWVFADAINNNAGLGFNGYDDFGEPKWDLISNIDVIPCELAINVRNSINTWNLSTRKWLRYIVYDRLPKEYATISTFGMSAIWHGFYPGYYMTFLNCVIFLQTTRTLKRKYGHLLELENKYIMIIFSILSFLTTRLVMGYGAFPFVILEFWPSFAVYAKLYFCFHLIALSIVFGLPEYIESQFNIDTSNLNNSDSPAIDEINNNHNQNKAQINIEDDDKNQNESVTDYAIEN